MLTAEMDIRGGLGKGQGEGGLLVCAGTEHTLPVPVLPVTLGCWASCLTSRCCENRARVQRGLNEMMLVKYEHEAWQEVDAQ